MAAAAKKSVTFTLSDAQPKTHVVRYNGGADDPMASAYISKSAVEKLGNPASVKITIEAA